MSRYTIKVLIFIGSLAIIGILTVQLHFISRSLRQENKQLDQTIRIALQHVAEKLSAYHETSLPYENIIHQYSPNYYVVNINDIIDVKVLEYYLTKEFDTRNLKLDFEYAIYDCATDKMVYGNYVNLSEKASKERQDKVFPKWDEYIYYFGVYFPNRRKIVMESLSVWYFISSILFVVVIFFGYSMFIILKQRRLSEIQKDFIHNITHEFKTPLTSISLSADVLSEDEIINEPERLKKYAGIIKTQASHLHEQVLKVLHNSDNEDNKFQLKISDVDLNVLISEIIEGFEARINKENVTIIFNRHLKNAVIKADKVHFKNSVINIIDNAIKYSGKKPVVDITLEKESHGILLTVKDNGKGIDKKYSKKVFEKFYRVPTGNIHDVKGFGLGLSYVKNVARAHGWKIKLISESGKGSAFRIFFKT